MKEKARLCNAGRRFALNIEIGAVGVVMFSWGVFDNAGFFFFSDTGSLHCCEHIGIRGAEGRQEANAPLAPSVSRRTSQAPQACSLEECGVQEANAPLAPQCKP